ncbi:MAG: 4-alpha-glucanotransferase [Reyranellaceae bacterium]
MSPGIHRGIDVFHVNARAQRCFLHARVDIHRQALRSQSLLICQRGRPAAVPSRFEAREPGPLAAVARHGDGTDMSIDPELLRRAQAAGIEPNFTDGEGMARQAGETTLRALLDLLNRDDEAAPTQDNCDSAVASIRAWQPPFAREGRRSWVLAVQLYSLGSARNLGHGDFTDLRRLLDLVADAGGGGVGVNPLHALSEIEPEEASPYSPSSRVFLNWLYIDIGDLPHLSEDELQRLRRKAAPASTLVDYAGIAAIKQRALRLAWRHFQIRATADEREAFAAFRREMGDDLRRYAAFCLLRRREGGSWRHWRRPWARPQPQDLDMLAHEQANEIGFHEFVQFHAHRQLAGCSELARRRGMDVGLYLDVAVGVHPDGFDAWNEPDAFLQGAAIGAPPDALNRVGQNWGLTGFHPHALRDAKWRPFRRMLAAAMRHAGAIRLDHVLGLNRLYVIPPGLEPTQGAYLRFPLREMLAAIAEESHAHRCLVVGEDLGTVPPGLRQVLQEFGIWTYRVLLFERDADGFLPPEAYPQEALATFSTHDLPTFAAWRDGLDIELLRSLGLPVGPDAARRVDTVESLAQALRLSGGRRVEHLAYADVVDFLCRTRARLLAFALEDILGLETQVNVPGTHREYPNWRTRIAFEPDRIAELLRRLALRPRA